MNHQDKPMRVDRDLANLLVKLIRSPTAFFILCDLIDKNNNLFKGEKNIFDILAKLDVKGNPYEKVRYDASPHQPFCDCSTGSHVNSITISIREQDGELFDFNGLQLEFVLKIN